MTSRLALPTRSKLSKLPGLALGFAGRGGGGPAYSPALPALPALNDQAITFGAANAARYIDLGNVGLPAGDWCIHVASRQPGFPTTDHPILSIGTPDPNIVGSNGSVTLVYAAPSGSAVSGQFHGGLLACLVDDAGNPGSIPNRFTTLYGRSVAKVLTGPSQLGTGDGSTSRSIFIQKIGTKLSFWYVDPYCKAREHNTYSGITFGAIAAKPAILGAINKTSMVDFSSSSLIQRVFFVGKTFTARQMEQIHSGWDPREFVSFSGAAGDRLWSFDAATTPVTGATYADKINGQVATLQGAGAWATATAIIPTSPQLNIPRVRLTGYGEVRPANGASATVKFDGYVSGPDDDIYIRIMNAAAEVVAFTKVGKSVNGVWSGFVSGIPRDVTIYTVQIRKGLGGTPFAAGGGGGGGAFSAGECFMLMGQSLMENMSIQGAALPTGTYSGKLTYYSTARSEQGAGQGFWPAGFLKSSANNTPYGFVKLAQSLANLAACWTCVANAAVSGSSISQWISTSNTFFFDQAVQAMQDTNCDHIIWNQGQSSLALGYQGYKDALTTLYAKFKAALPDRVLKFGVLPLSNTFFGDDPDQCSQQRRAQYDWVADQIAAGDSNVYLLGAVNDTTLNGDNIHATYDAAGEGKYAERIAQSIAQKQGYVANSGVGPLITSAAWNAAAIVDVVVVHNGGTALQTPNVADVTGFEASIDGFATKLTISSAVILNATTIRLTLSATPASAPAIRYQWGRPGFGTTAAANGLSNPVYDNRSPAINTTLGYPVQFTPSAVQSV